MGIILQPGTVQRVKGAAMFVPVIAAFMLSRDVAQWLFLAGALVMVWEFCAMLQLSKALQAMLLLDFTLFGLPASLFMHLEMLAGSPLLPAMLALGGMVALLVGAITRDLAAAVFVGLLVLCILSGRNLLGQDGGHHLVLGLGFVVAVCDIAAYFVGRRVGGPRLAPGISPNKTLSGAAGGMFAAVIGSVILLQLVDAGSETRFTFAFAMCAGIVIAVLAQAGDLFESFIKRRRGVKDSGQLIPGHGGFLDRFDGYLLTLPALYICSLAF